MTARKDAKRQVAAPKKQEAAKKAQLSNLSPRTRDNDAVKGGMNKHYSGNHNETLVRLVRL